MLLMLLGNCSLHCGAEHGIGAPSFGDAEAITGELVVDAYVAEEVGEVHWTATSLGVHEWEALTCKWRPEEAIV
jgi:hypothetical protein